MRRNGDGRRDGHVYREPAMFPNAPVFRFREPFYRARYPVRACEPRKLIFEEFSISCSW